MTYCLVCCTYHQRVPHLKTRMYLQNWKILFYFLSTTVSVVMLGLVLWMALSQMDLIMILTCRIKFLMMPLVVTKS